MSACRIAPRAGAICGGSDRHVAFSGSDAMALGARSFFSNGLACRPDPWPRRSAVTKTTWQTAARRAFVEGLRQPPIFRNARVRGRLPNDTGCRSTLLHRAAQAQRRLGESPEWGSKPRACKEEVKIPKPGKGSGARVPRAAQSGVEGLGGRSGQDDGHDRCLEDTGLTGLRRDQRAGRCISQPPAQREVAEPLARRRAYQPGPANGIGSVAPELAVPRFRASFSRTGGGFFGPRFLALSPIAG